MADEESASEPAAEPPTPSDRPRHARWMPAACAVVAVAVGVALTLYLTLGKGSADGPADSSSAQATAEDAYRQFRNSKAGNAFGCSTAFSDMSVANVKGDVPRVRDAARKYRDLVARWNDELGTMRFPAAAQPVVDQIRRGNMTEIHDLDVVAAVTDPDDANSLVVFVFFDDWTVINDVDRLKSALGHPDPRAKIAADQLELARQTYLKDSAWIGQLFAAALAHSDLAAAKAANAVEQSAAQHYLDALDSINWPAGVEAAVGTLKEKIRALIEFDRRQVDVATVAQIVRAPPGGTPLTRVEADVEGALFDRLNKMDDSPAEPLSC
jgi:hypothetical protein